MEFLDKTGVSTLWNKIKDYVGTETKKYLPLSGGRMTGDISGYKNSHGTVYWSIGTNGNVDANEGTGWIMCSTPGGTDTIVQGGGFDIYGDKHLQIREDDITIDDTSIIGYSKSEADSRYLNISGGTMTGDIVRKNVSNSTLYSIGTVANSGQILCFNNITGYDTKITGGIIELFGGNGTATIPDSIEYSHDNIHFTFIIDSTSHTYKFNLQKLIDDGYLIEE